MTPVSKNGSEPAKETASQLQATEANARAESAVAETCEPKKSATPAHPVRSAESSKPLAPPPPSKTATAADKIIAIAAAKSPAPATRTGVTDIRLNELPFHVELNATAEFLAASALQRPPK